MENIKNETLSIEATIKEYNTDPKRGLSSEEAKRRLEKYGKNELKEKKKKNWVQIFISQLNDPMIFVLFAAVAVTIGVSIYETVTTLKAGNPFIFRPL